jgi:hypothetical protein
MKMSVTAQCGLEEQYVHALDITQAAVSMGIHSEISEDAVSYE